MGRIIITLFAVILSAFFVIKAYFFQLNGQGTIEFYDRLPLFFSPANFTYFAWFIVFIALIIWVYLNVKNRATNLRLTSIQTILFLMIAVLQITTITEWHKERFFASIILGCIQLLLFFVLYLTYPLQKDCLKLRMPIAIYFGWVTFDFFIKVCYVFVLNEWGGFGLSAALWAVIFMTVGVLVSLHLRYHHFDVAFPIVFVWGYIGIVLNNGFDEIFVTAAALFLICALVVCTIYLKKSSVKIQD